MTDEFSQLWAGVMAADPLDAAPRLILADWLAERGRDPDLERGLRWAAAMGWWPKPPQRDGWWWGTYVRDANWPTGGWGPAASAMVDAVCSIGRQLQEPGVLCGCSAPTPERAVIYVGMALSKLEAARS
jgi:uncharacterized protein (TIGR02996 family)